MQPEPKPKPLVRDDWRSERWRVYFLPHYGLYAAAAPYTLYCNREWGESLDNEFATIEEALTYAQARASKGS